jgi:methionine-rich copper-binding protein CopC
MRLLTPRRGSFERLDGRLLLDAALPAAMADDAPPRVVASSILEGERISAGTRIYQVRFDGPLDEDVLDGGDVELLGADTGARQVDLLLYDSGSSILVMQFDDLTDDDYTLRLVSGDGRFEDTAGRDLDGEANPFTTVPSGDGAAGGDFVVHFSVRRESTPWPVPLSAEPPAGSLIYSASTTVRIDTPGRRVTFSIDLDAGQTIAVLADPTATLQPTILLENSQGTRLNQAVAGAEGMSVVLPASSVATPGRYTISLGGAAGTTGSASLRLLLNAEIENEANAQRTNDEAAAAQELDGSRIALGPPGAERGAVAGSLSNGDVDWYRFRLEDSELVTLTLNSLGATVELFDEGSGALAKSVSDGDEAHVVRDFRDPTTDGQSNSYLVRVSGDPGEYHLVFTVGADLAAGEGDDGAAQIQDISPTGTVLGAAFTPTTFAVIGDYGDFSDNADDVAAMVELWQPEFVLTTADNQYGNAALGSRDWTRGIGNLYGDFILGRSDNRYAEQTSDVQRFFPTLGNHDVVGNSAAGYLDYFHDDMDGVPASGRLPPGVHEPLGTYYDFQRGPVHFFALDSEHARTDAASRTAQMQWLETGLTESTAPWKLVYFHDPPFSSSGSEAAMQWPFEAWGVDAVLTGHKHNYERVLRDGLPYFVVGTSGASLHAFNTTVVGSEARYNSDHGTMLVTALASEVTFDFFSIDDGARGGAGGRLIDSFSIEKSAGGGAGAGSGDTFQFAVQQGDRLTLETFTPFAGPAEPPNTLDPAIELLDPQGTVVATADDGGQGPNARLEHTATTTGSYTARLLGNGGTAGEFVLHVQGHTGAAASLKIVEVSLSDRALSDGATLTAAPEQITFDFNDPIRLDTLQASDMLVDGQPAVAVTAIDGDTVVFELPPLDDGLHEIQFSAGAVLNLQATPNEAITRSFFIDSTPPRVTGVSLGGMTFSPRFVQHLQSQQLGRLGYDVPDGPQQAIVVPWAQVDQIHLQFSEDVIVRRQHLSLFGLNVDRYETVAFGYDNTTFTASWTLARPLPADKLLIDLSDSVQDTAGNQLDGAWVDQLSRFPSGDAMRDDDQRFQFRLNVLPGDADGKGSVGSEDILDVVFRLGRGVDDLQYDSRADVNADGLIDADDLREVVVRLGTRLPIGVPTSGSGGDSRASVDTVFERLGAQAPGQDATARRTDRTRVSSAQLRSPLRRLQAAAVDPAIAEQTTRDWVRILRRRAGSDARR